MTHLISFYKRILSIHFWGNWEVQRFALYFLLLEGIVFIIALIIRK